MQDFKRDGIGSSDLGFKSRVQRWNLKMEARTSTNCHFWNVNRKCGTSAMKSFQQTRRSPWLGSVAIANVEFTLAKKKIYHDKQWILDVQKLVVIGTCLIWLPSWADVSIAIWSWVGEILGYFGMKDPLFPWISREPSREKLIHEEELSGESW